eukprot:1324178-Amphidinium_carterae.1
MIQPPCTQCGRACDASQRQGAAVTSRVLTSRRWLFLLFYIFYGHALALRRSSCEAQCQRLRSERRMQTANSLHVVVGIVLRSLLPALAVQLVVLGVEVEDDVLVFGDELADVDAAELD